MSCTKPGLMQRLLHQVFRMGPYHRHRRAGDFLYLLQWAADHHRLRAEARLMSDMLR